MVAHPVCRSALTNSIPAWLVLAVIMAPANNESRLSPYNLRPHLKSAPDERLVDLAGMLTSMPAVNHIASEQRPRLSPINAVVIGHLA